LPDSGLQARIHPVPGAVEHRQPPIAAERGPVPREKIPIECIERAGIGPGAVSRVPGM